MILYFLYLLSIHIYSFEISQLYNSKQMLISNPSDPDVLHVFDIQQQSKQLGSIQINHDQLITATHIYESLFILFMKEESYSLMVYDYSKQQIIQQRHLNFLDSFTNQTNRWMEQLFYKSNDGMLNVIHNETDRVIVHTFDQSLNEQEIKLNKTIPSLSPFRSVQVQRRGEQEILFLDHEGTYSMIGQNFETQLIFADSLIAIQDSFKFLYQFQGFTFSFDMNKQQSKPERDLDIDIEIKCAFPSPSQHLYVLGRKGNEFFTLTPTGKEFRNTITCQQITNGLLIIQQSQHLQYTIILPTESDLSIQTSLPLFESSLEIRYQSMVMYKYCDLLILQHPQTLFVLESLQLETIPSVDYNIHNGMLYLFQDDGDRMGLTFQFQQVSLHSHSHPHMQIVAQHFVFVQGSYPKALLFFEHNHQSYLLLSTYTHTNRQLRLIRFDQQEYEEYDQKLLDLSVWKQCRTLGQGQGRIECSFEHFRLFYEVDMKIWVVG